MSRLARGAIVVVLALIAARTGAAPTPREASAPPGDGTTRAGPIAAPRASGPRPDYDCSKGGFCGTEGWAYGSYAADTKESTGCGVGEDGVDRWALSASHSPTLPEFARPYCAFFYGFKACSVPTVVCEN